MKTYDNSQQFPSTMSNSTQNPFPESIYGQNPVLESVYSLPELDQSWGNQINPNLIAQNPPNPSFNAPNPDLYRMIFQNQNQHDSRFLMPEIPQAQLPQSPRYYVNNNSGLSVNPNPSFGDLSSLEDVMSRLSLSPYQLSLLDQYSRQQSLNRMRSMSAGLGLLRSSPNLNVAYQQNSDNSYQNSPNRGTHRGNRSLTNYNRSGYHGYGADSLQRGPSVYPRGNSGVRYSSLMWLELEQLKGQIENVSKTQEGSRFLHEKIDERRWDQIEMIFLEIKDHVCDLVVDQFATGVFQKLFGVCSEEQMTQLILILIQNEQKLLSICVHQHGTRAVQKMIEYTKTPEQRAVLVSALKNITVSLSKNNNGHHVIEQCFKFFPADDTKCLLDEIANSCLQIAMDKSGCCVLQKSLPHAQGENRNRLLAILTENAFLLSEHPYGNYVVQYVLSLNLPQVETTIMERLMGSFVALSMNKYGSNVVEKCIRYFSDNNATKIIQELTKISDFLNVAQDPYGNYVIQTAIESYKGEAFYTLARVIDDCHQYLHTHLHGKKVLGKLDEIIGKRPIRF